MSKTDLIENEVKDAEAKEEVGVVEKKAPFAGTEYPDKRKPFVKQHNVIIVRKTANFKTLVVQTKNLLKNQFDSVELHGVDDESFLTVSLVAQCLLKYKYVTLTRLKTKTHQTILKRDDAKNGKDEDPDNRVILQPKLVVHLSKTVDFDSTACSLAAARLRPPTRAYIGRSYAFIEGACIATTADLLFRIPRFA